MRLLSPFIFSPSFMGEYGVASSVTSDEWAGDEEGVDARGEEGHYEWEVSDHGVKDLPAHLPGRWRRGETRMRATM